MNQYYNPVHTVQGSGSISEIPRLLQELSPNGGSVLLLVWSESVLKLDFYKNLELNEHIQVYPLCFTASNPTVEQLYQVYHETKQMMPETVVAVGGGSVMDVGKSLCCLYGKELSTVDELRTLICEKNYGVPSARWIGVPTTAGTGSEVTCWATIWDPQKQEKRSVECRENYAYAAVVDPELMLDMPVGLAVSSALDAVAHGVESYWAKGTNQTSRVLALGSVRMIMEHMDDLMDGGRHAQEYISCGSMLAGAAFSNTKTTACHSISYPLTMQYQIPHGTAVSMLLAPVLRINQERTEHMELMFRALGVEDADQLEERIQDILKRAGIPCSLEQWNVEHGKLQELASLGITKGRADNNPVELTVDGIENILESIYRIR